MKLCQKKTLVWFLTCTAGLKVAFVHHGHSEQNTNHMLHPEWCNSRLTLQGIEDAKNGAIDCLKTPFYKLKDNGDVDKSTETDYTSFLGEDTSKHFLLASPLQRAYHTLELHYKTAFVVTLKMKDTCEDDKNVFVTSEDTFEEKNVQLLPELRELECLKPSQVLILDGKENCETSWISIVKNMETLFSLDDALVLNADAGFKCTTVDALPKNMTYDTDNYEQKTNNLYSSFKKLLEFMLQKEADGYESIVIGGHSYWFTMFANYVLTNQLSNDTTEGWKAYRAFTNWKEYPGLCNGCVAMFEIKNEDKIQVSDVQYNKKAQRQTKLSLE